MILFTPFLDEVPGHDLFNKKGLQQGLQDASFQLDNRSAFKEVPSLLESALPLLIRAPIQYFSHPWK